MTLTLWLYLMGLVLVGAAFIGFGVRLAVWVYSRVARVLSARRPQSSLPTLETMKGRAARDARRNYSTDSDGWDYSTRADWNQRIAGDRGR